MNIDMIRNNFGLSGQTDEHSSFDEFDAAYEDFIGDLLCGDRCKEKRKLRDAKKRSKIAEREARTAAMNSVINQPVNAGATSADPSSGGNSSSAVWLIVGVSVLLVGGVVAYVIGKKKQNKA